MEPLNTTIPFMVTTMTQRGQVTIPARVRRMLGLKPRQPVAFTISNGQVQILPVTTTLESAYGSVTPKHHPEDFNALIRSAKEERSKKMLAKHL